MSFIKKCNTFLVTLFLLLCIFIDIVRLQRNEGLSLNPFSKDVSATFLILAMIGFVRLIAKGNDKISSLTQTGAQDPVLAPPQLSGQELKEKLKEIRSKIPGLNWKETDKEIEVSADSDTGFPLSLAFGYSDPLEYTVYYLADHVHFRAGREAEVLSTFLIGLSDVVRLKVVSRQGVDYIFSSEIKPKGQERYIEVNKTVLFKPEAWKFWIKKDVRYLQNRYLTGETLERLLQTLLPRGN